MTQPETLLDPNNSDIDPNITNYLELVPENQRDPEALAKKAYHADMHIRNLEKRQDDFREMILNKDKDLENRAKLEDLIRQLETARQQSASNTSSSVNENQPKTISPEQVETLVSNKILEIDKTRKEQENFQTVKAKLTERFGSNYQSVLSEQIRNLGITEQQADIMARNSPNVLIKALGLDQQPTREGFQSPPQSSSTFRPKGAQKRTLAYYEEMKKANPKLYLDRKTLIQMDKDSQELGEAFFDV